MGWSAAFLSALESRTLAPMFVLERVQIADEPGAAWSIASHGGLGADEVRIAVRGVQVQGATLSPRGWSSTLGGWSVTIVGDIGELCKRITRGTIVALRAGFPGMAPGDFEPIALGQVVNLRGTPPMWRLEMVDASGAFRSRLSTAYTFTTLFADQGTTTTLSAGYTPGDTSIQVASTTAFARESGASGLLLVTPAGGDPFYLTYTGTATGPVRFTGVGTSDVHGTTRIAAAIGDEVREIALLAGHPLDIARKVLCSTGAGTNGAYDTLPSAWGLAVTDEWIDHEDVDTYRDTVMVPSSGSHDWEIIQSDAVDDAYSWLASWLSLGGMFLTVRQGRLTIRAGQDTQAAAYHSGISITDAEIVEVEEYEAWDPGHSPEYMYVTVDTQGIAGSASPTDAATLPAAKSVSYDLSDLIFASNFDEQAREILGRVEEHLRRVPERVVLRCAGLRLAQLATGDVVDLTTTRAHSRQDGVLGFVGRRAEVDEVSTDWTGGTVRVGLLVYPETDDALT